MAQKYFITAQDVKDHTDAQQNTDEQYFEPRIARCQEKYILPILGPALYEELCAALEAEGRTVPVPIPDNLDELHAQVVPVQSQWVFLKSLPFLLVKAKNKGLEAEQNAVSDSQYRTYREEAQQEAVDRTKDLKAWLDKNKSRFPNYKPAVLTPRPIGGIVL